MSLLRDPQVSYTEIEERPYRPEAFGLSDFELCWGIMVGCCVDGNTPHITEVTTEMAHAHTQEDDEWQGWICIYRKKDVLTKRGNPSPILLHELAHILAGENHTDRWRAAMTLLGQKKALAVTNAPSPSAGVTGSVESASVVEP